MTAKEITVALYWSYRSSSDLLLPRYTPRDWWECDVWRLTRAGFVDEFEIKTSVSDFRADAKKEKASTELFDRETRKWSTRPTEKKHELLAGDAKGPNRFWFVLPRDLRGKVEVPEYAGIIIAHRGNTLIEKQAPKRHGRKWTGNRESILETFYHRFWNHELGSKSTPEPLVEEECFPDIIRLCRPAA